MCHWTNFIVFSPMKIGEFLRMFLGRLQLMYVINMFSYIIFKQTEAHLLQLTASISG